MNHIPRMPFENVFCLFPDLLSSPSHGIPASIHWVPGERNRHHTPLEQPGTHSPPPHPYGRDHCWRIQFCATLPWRRSGAGKESLHFSVSTCLPFLCSNGIRESLLGKVGLLQCLFSVGVCQSQYSPDLLQSWPVGLWPLFWLLLFPQLVQRLIFVPVPQCTCG